VGPIGMAHGAWRMEVGSKQQTAGRPGGGGGGLSPDLKPAFTVLAPKAEVQIEMPSQAACCVF
jgi:hypothetical protein